MNTITSYEKDKAIEKSRSLAKTIVEDSEGKLFFKLFSLYFSNIPELKEIKIISESDFDNQELMIAFMAKIVEYLAKSANNVNLKVYTTGQLSEIFGVSITSINNWIDENRFIGIRRTKKNKHIRIAENVMWISTNGEAKSVKSIVEAYNKNNVTLDYSSENEKKVIEESISFFENKYKGKYEDTLMKFEVKSNENLRDESEWKYLLRRRYSD
jgi:hypothetical protein